MEFVGIIIFYITVGIGIFLRARFVNKDSLKLSLINSCIVLIAMPIAMMLVKLLGVEDREWVFIVLIILLYGVPISIISSYFEEDE